MSTFFSGLKDSIQFPISLFLLYGSNRLFKNYLKSVFTSLILSVIIWSLSIYYFKIYEQPKHLKQTEQSASLLSMLSTYQSNSNTDNPTDNPTDNSIANPSAYQSSNISLSSSIFMYLCFIFNQYFFSEISKRSFEIFTGVPPAIKRQSIGR